MGAPVWSDVFKILNVAHANEEIALTYLGLICESRVSELELRAALAQENKTVRALVVSRAQTWLKTSSFDSVQRHYAHLVATYLLGVFPWNASLDDWLPLKAGDPLPAIFMPLAKNARDRTGVLPTEAAAFALVDVHATAAVIASLAPSVRLSEKLTAALLLTNTPDEDVKLPFNGFHLVFPHGFFPAGGGQFFTQATISRRQEKGHEWVSIGFSGTDRRDDRPRIGLVSSTWDYVPDREDITSNFAEILESRDAVVSSVPKMHRLLRALAAYIAMLRDQFQPVNLKAIVRDGNNGRVKRTAVYDLGRTVMIAPRLVDAAKQGALSTRGWRLLHQTCVMGHWRWQPFGSRVSVGPHNARRQWIEPHMRGPSGAEAFHKVYAFEEADPV